MTDWEGASDELKKIYNLIPSVSYHIDEEGVDVEVGVLLSIADDAGLHDAAATLHLKARGGHGSHLETLQVTQSPGQDLRGQRAVEVLKK